MRQHISTALERNRVGVSVASTAALMLVLIVVALAVPMSPTAEHFSGHVAVGLPLAVLLVLALRMWPRPTPDLAAWLARGTLLAGLGIAGAGQLTEAIGAFGFTTDGFGPANGLAVLHDAAVVVSPIGIVLLLVGGSLTAGVLLARRRAATGSRTLSIAAVVGVAGAVAFMVGGMVFGY